MLLTPQESLSFLFSSSAKNLAVADQSIRVWAVMSKAVIHFLPLPISNHLRCPGTGELQSSKCLQTCVQPDLYYFTDSWKENPDVTSGRTCDVHVQQYMLTSESTWRLSKDFLFSFEFISGTFTH